jgi:hypothetical protein
MFNYAYNINTGLLRVSTTALKKASLGTRPMKLEVSVLLDFAIETTLVAWMCSYSIAIMVITMYTVGIGPDWLYSNIEQVQIVMCSVLYITFGR